MSTNMHRIMATQTVQNASGSHLRPREDPGDGAQRCDGRVGAALGGAGTDVQRTQLLLRQFEKLNFELKTWEAEQLER